MNLDVNNPKISIIVPVYQVEPYLRACLDSILAQSFADWEMLLVDDGSADGSEHICDEYGERDERIRVFHQENQGLSAARNTGLDNARGQYYTMVDSDDVLLSRDYLHLLYYAAVSNNADMSVCGHLSFPDAEMTPNAVDMIKKVRCCTGKEFYHISAHSDRHEFTDKHGNLLTEWYSPYGAHGKLYKRGLFENLRYPVGHVLEDMAVAHRLYYLRERVAVVEVYMYGHRIRSTGIMGSMDGSILNSEKIYIYADQLSFFTEIGDSEMSDYVGRMLRWCLRNKELS